MIYEYNNISILDKSIELNLPYHWHGDELT